MMCYIVLIFTLLLLSFGLLESVNGSSLVTEGRLANIDSVESNDIASSVLALAPNPKIQNINDTVDLILEVLQGTLKKTNHTTVPIPDIEEEFIRRVHDIKIKGKLTGKKGWFKDLSSVHRTGDATMTQSGHNITVSVDVGLELMELGYDYLQVKLESISLTGNLTATVKSNSLSVQVDVVMSDSGKCNLTLQELKFTQLGGFQVQVQGLKKPFDWLVSMIATVVTKRFEDKIRKEVEDHLSIAVQEGMDKFHC